MSDGLRLNIGCGRKPLAGYLNIDMQRYDGVDYCHADFMQMDVRQELAAWLLGKQVKEIRADQFLEHLSLREGQRFLATCYTALHPNGLLRLTVPDFAAHVADYIDRKQRVPLRNPQSAEYAGPFRPEVNVLRGIIYEWGHRMIYDAEMLATVLAAARFRVLEIGRPDGANVVATATPA